MRARKHLQQITTQLVFFLVLFTVVGRLVFLQASIGSSTETTYSKSSIPLKTDCQLPFEEKEKEQEQSAEKQFTHLLFACLPNASKRVTATVCLCYGYSPSVEFFHGRPIYLSKRYLLI